MTTNLLEYIYDNAPNNNMWARLLIEKLKNDYAVNEIAKCTRPDYVQFSAITRLICLERGYTEDMEKVFMQLRWKWFQSLENHQSFRFLNGKECSGDTLQNQFLVVVNGLGVVQSFFLECEQDAVALAEEASRAHGGATATVYERKCSISSDMKKGLINTSGELYSKNLVNQILNKEPK